MIIDYEIENKMKKPHARGSTKFYFIKENPEAEPSGFVYNLRHNFKGLQIAISENAQRAKKKVPGEESVRLHHIMT